jgi:hypothetical protein
VLDCLYMYGRPAPGVPFDEDTTMNPCSRKGELRAMLARELFEAHARGVEALAAALGRRGSVRHVPDWLFRATGLVDPMLGAIAEMTYQWKVPYVMDERRFREVLGVGGGDRAGSGRRRDGGVDTLRGGLGRRVSPRRVAPAGTVRRIVVELSPTRRAPLVSSLLVPAHPRGDAR